MKSVSTRSRDLPIYYLLCTRRKKIAINNTTMAKLSPPLQLLLGLFISQFLPSQSCLHDHKQALLQFKSSFTSILASNSSSFNSSTLTGLESWNSSSNCCHWDRVFCSSQLHSRPANVVSLHLDYLPPMRSTDQSMPSHVLMPLFSIKSLKLLDVSDNSLQGEIPGNGFANLTKLVHLYMSGNNFNGSIPPQIFHSTSLLHLDLGTNSLGGYIPQEVGNLTKLQKLTLEWNHLSGELPTSILHLKDLKVLALSENRLSGQIPSEIGNLSKLFTLNLMVNKFTGTIPPSIEKLSKLKRLHLLANNLSGEIPSGLFNIKPLVELHLGGEENTLTWKNNGKNIVPKFMLSTLFLRSCGLVGEIPKWISTQKTLHFLNLSRNKLEGSLPKWLLTMEFEELNLSENKLTGSIPPRLFQSQILEFINLSQNKFSGELPENIGDATSLIYLMLSGNNFSGPIPKSISNINSLQLLDLSENILSGNTFPVFQPNGSLGYVDYSSNEFSGMVPVDFPTDTWFLALQSNNFSGSLSQNLTNLKSLNYLFLHDNRITGNFPNFLSQISTLEVLNLRNNSFHGSIFPETILNLIHLQILDISNNRLTGNIPTDMGNLVGMIQTPDKSSSRLNLLSFQSQLEMNWKKSMQGLSSDRLDIYFLLDLSKNQLSGEIPSSLGHLKKLKQLNISYNGLSADIPSSFGDLESIESLDLSHNRLSGSLPPSLVKLQQLTVLDVSNNKLEGKIPVGGQMGTMNYPDYFANNSGLCGMQIQVPCPEDSVPKTPQVDEITEDPWFLWEGAWLGLPLGFFLSVWIMFLSGYLFPAPKPRHRILRSRQRLNPNVAASTPAPFLNY